MNSVFTDTQARDYRLFFVKLAAALVLQICFINFIF